MRPKAPCGRSSPSPPRCASAIGATTSQTANPPAPEESKPQAQAPAEPQAPTTVPAAPLKQPAPMQVVVQANPASPLVSFRLVFRSGSVDDTQGKEGITSLTADTLSDSGTQSLTYAQLLETLFPMTAELGTSTDKEFTIFAGRVHKDFLPRFLDIFTDVLLKCYRAA